VICGGTAGEGSAIAVASRLKVLGKVNCLASSYSSRCRGDANASCEGCGRRAGMKLMIGYAAAMARRSFLPSNST
jgi:hypothetical protein